MCGNLVLFLLGIGYGMTAFSQEIVCANSVDIQNPWVREPIAGSSNTAAYLTFNNKGNTLCILSGAKTRVAKRVELHEHINQNGVMRMRQVSGIVLPKQTQTELKPGGLHLMLFDLTSDLKSGNGIDMTLEYEDKSQKTIVLPMLTSAKSSKLGSSSGQ